MSDNQRIIALAVYVLISIIFAKKDDVEGLWQYLAYVAFGGLLLIFLAILAAIMLVFVMVF